MKAGEAALRVARRQGGQAWRGGLSVALLAGVLAWGLAGCERKDPLEKARILIANKDRAAAVLQLKSAIQANPSSAEARLLLGGQLLDAGDAAAAEIELNRALELGVAEPRVIPLLVRAMLALGQQQRVIGQFGGLVWPDAQATAELKSLVAQAQATTGDLDGARASLERALHAVPDHEPSLLLQARVAAAGGDATGALRQIDALLARHANSADAWVLKGELLARSRAEPAQVMQAYRQALALRPDHVGAHAALMSLLLAQRDADAARAQFDAMQKALPKHPRTIFFEGQIAMLKGEYPRARELFQLLLRGAPDNLMLLQSAGAVELRLNAPAQAEALLSKAVQIAPDAVPARRLLAQSYLSLGQPAKALAVLEPLILPTGHDAEALSLAGQAQLQAGNGAAASALFDRATKLKPDDSRIRTARAVSNLVLGRGESAIAELESVASADSGVTADLALISTHLRRKDYAAALIAVDALEKKKPTQALAPHLRGQVLLLKRDVAGARLAFELAVQRDANYFPSVAALAGLDFRDNKPDAAKARFDKLVAANPKNGAARLALAELARRSGADRDAVAALLDGAVKANPGDVAPRLALIDHHLATNNPKAALAAAQSALARMPDHFELLGRQGRAQMAIGDQQQAVTTYNRMIQLQANSPVGHLGLAEAQLASGDLASAGRSVRRALEVTPASLPAQRLAITVAMRQKQPAQALALARGMQKQRPGHAEGYLIEGEIEIADKHWDNALAVLRKALTRTEPGHAAERLHGVLRAAGKGAEADAFATSWTREHPSDALFQFYLGDLALARKDLAVAEHHYQAVLQINPEHALALNNIAWLMLQQKRPGALAYAERAFRSSPDRPALIDTLALAYAAENQPAKAVELQKRALALQPENPFLRLNLARFLAQAGDKRQAKTELDRLARLEDKFPKQAEVAELLKGLGGR
jgi:putative PEP-CTERM system TPR-repeat lipoprotein